MLWNEAAVYIVYCQIFVEEYVIQQILWHRDTSVSHLHEYVCVLLAQRCGCPTTGREECPVRGTYVQFSKARANNVQLQNQIICSYVILAEHYYVPNGHSLKIKCH